MSALNSAPSATHRPPAKRLFHVKLGILFSLFTLLAALLIPGLAATPLALADETDPLVDLNTRAALSAGHLDLTPVYKDGKLQLWVRDDASTPSTYRSLENSVFVLGATAKQQVPEGNEYAFTGVKPGQSAWVVPQVEVPGVIWLGWNTQNPGLLNNVNGQVKITFEGMQGPGKLTVFLQDGNLGKPTLLWDSSIDQAQPINVDLGSHTHVNWVFTEPGVHLVRLTVAATLKDGKEVMTSQVLRFSVGEQDKQADQSAFTAKWKPRPLPAGVSADTLADQSSGANTSNSALAVKVVAGALIVLAVGLWVLVAVVSKRRKLAQKQALKGAIADEVIANGGESEAAPDTSSASKENETGK